VRVLLQRVSRAEARVRDRTVARSGPGLLLLVGIGANDAPELVTRMADKVFHLRIFEDDGGKMNRSLEDTGGEILVVPQFTLYGNTSRGRRPSWIEAAPPREAAERVEAFSVALEALGIKVHRGAFQEHMEVELVNDGPVTLLLEA
jgi:D-tyrosyl-tRNA(Tyr) deacylase